MTEHPSIFATTMQKEVTKATTLQPKTEIENAVAEYCVSSGYVLMKDVSNERALVTHFGNVVMELPMNAYTSNERKLETC
ncbi:MAG: hypothetical protein AAF961_01805 [Planctomycetota bacterium]